MRSSTAIGLAVATILPLCSAGSHAEDVPPPGPPKAEHVIIDSTTDAGRGGRSFDFNATFAPFGTIYENGFRIRLTPNYSWYQYKLSDPPGLGSGYSVGFEILPGFGIVLPRVSLVALFGPAIVESYDSGKSKTLYGSKAVVSVYAVPTDQTMFYGSVNYVTLGNGYQVQLKTGYKVPANFYVGPEVKFSGSNGNSQMRIGAHLSSLKVGQVYLSFTGGYLRDGELGQGAFLSVNLYTTF